MVYNFGWLLCHNFDIFVIVAEFVPNFFVVFVTDIIVTFLLTTNECYWQMLLPVGC